MSDSVRPQRWQPIRLPCPWDSPGKNTGLGCHFLIQFMKGKSESEVTQSCLTPSDPMDCSLPGSSIHGILQASVLEWVAIACWREKKKKQSFNIVNQTIVCIFQIFQSFLYYWYLRNLYFVNSCFQERMYENDENTYKKLSWDSVIFKRAIGNCGLLMPKNFFFFFQVAKSNT